MGHWQGGWVGQAWKWLEVPQHLCFDGSEGTWKLYRQLLEKECTDRGLDEGQVRHLLEASLRGPARAFYKKAFPRADEVALADVLGELEERYCPSLPRTQLMACFTSLEQKEGEALAIWAERVMEVGAEAYATSSVEEREEMLTLRFCQGMWDQNIGYEVLTSGKAKTLREAVHQARKTVANRAGFRRGVRKGVMCVDGGAEGTQEQPVVPSMSVNAVAATPDPLVGVMEKQSKMLEGLLQEVRKLQLGSGDGVGQRSPLERGVFPGRCYACDGYGPTRARCPKGSSLPWKRGPQGRSRAPEGANEGSGDRDEQPLNGEGSAPAGR